MKRFALLIVMALSLVGVMAREALPCRPLKTEDCGTTPQGRFEMEMSIESDKYKCNDRELNYGGVINYGLTEKWDIGWEIPINYLKPVIGRCEKGLGDVLLRSKYLVISETDSCPAFLVKPTFKIPSGDDKKELGSGKSDAGILFALTKSFGSLAVGFNAGYTMVDLPKKKKWDSNVGFFGLGFLQPLSQTFTLAGEITFEPVFGGKSTDNSSDACAGLIYNLSDKIVLDFSFRYGLSDASPHHAFGSGVSINF